MKIAVAGATGYIGGRLVPRLLQEGHEVVCVARNPRKLDGRPWRSEVEVRYGDVQDPESLEAALAGCEVAYYLVHSMGGKSDFVAADRDAARTFAAAAAADHLKRIVYLGGLGAATDQLSTHLSSRHETGAVLAAGTVPVTELRAAVIIGSGSVSFEMLRYLTEVLPVMVTPKWVGTRCQPIAIRDVLAYLVAVLDDDQASHVYEVGGPDVVSYREMMQVYAEEAGLPKRLLIPVPVLTPRLSSHWIGLVTPVPAGVAKPLVDSLRNEVVVHDTTALAKFAVQPIPFRQAVVLALARSNSLEVETRWSDASTSPAQPFAGDPSWAGGTLFVDRQEAESTAPAADLYWGFARIGGSVGYYSLDWAWQARGLIDRAVGGVGLRRGRRHPEEVRLHDSIDFWRVAALEPGSMLQLAAEMKLPGEAWLEWRVEPTDAGRKVVQTAYFRPKGLSGRLYWYAMLPFHHLIFRSMLDAIVSSAEDRPTPPSAEQSPGTT
ncbi:MAG: SDR family oxidoreductase [Propionibacteriaceae bacterium]|nr:SDR family oxidoreductase [Propionibacteriaceae bacterium]